MYRDGIGTEKNIQSAMEWYTIADQNGLSWAKRELEECKKRSLNKTENSCNLMITQESRNEFHTISPEISCELSDNLTILKFKGTETNLIQIATAGDRDTQFRLGCMYRDGNTVDTDIKKAIEWFSLASDNGHVRAKYELARLLEQSGSKSQQEQIPHLLEESAIAGDDDAAIHLAHFYIKGKFVSENWEKAAEFLRTCSDRGSTRAKFELAELLYHFKSEEAHSESFKLCSELVESETNKDAMFRLYLCYRYAVGTKKDLGLAEFWVKQAIKAGHKGAVKELDSLIKNNV